LAETTPAPAEPPAQALDFTGVTLTAEGAGYLGVVGVTLVQALRGQPLLAPDALTLGTLALALAAVAAGWWLAGRGAPRVAYSREGSLGSAT
jgi:hypothetical protein